MSNLTITSILAPDLDASTVALALQDASIRSERDGHLATAIYQERLCIEFWKAAGRAFGAAVRRHEANLARLIEAEKALPEGQVAS